MAAPVVSVITPTFNHERYIGQCIESVLSQTFSDWEMIIVDDGSTDHTSDIVSKFSTKDSRVQYFKQENAGIFKLADTYNFALSKTKGEYIAILEGDDIWSKDKLAIQIQEFKKYPDAIVCWGRATSVIDLQTEVYETHPKNEKVNLKYYTNNPVGSFFNIVFSDFPAPLTFLIKREALIKAGQFSQHLPFPAVDLPTFLNLSNIGTFIYIPHVLGSWRQHIQQVTKNNNIDLITGSTNIIIEHYKTLSPETKQFINFDLDDIKKIMKKRMIISYARSGRFKLIKKQYYAARVDYFKAIFLGNPFVEHMWKIRAITGLILSFFHTDVEFLAKFLGKKHYK